MPVGLRRLQDWTKVSSLGIIWKCLSKEIQNPDMKSVPRICLSHSWGLICRWNKQTDNQKKHPHPLIIPSPGIKTWFPKYIKQEKCSCSENINVHKRGTLNCRLQPSGDLPAISSPTWDPRTFPWTSFNLNINNLSFKTNETEESGHFKNTRFSWESPCTNISIIFINFKVRIDGIQLAMHWKFAKQA